MTSRRSTGLPLRALIAIMLMAAAPVRSSPAAEPVEPAPALRLYQRACQSCHGAEGQGKPGLYPPLANADWMNAPRPDRLIRIMLQGIAGPIEVNGKPFPTPTPFMPGHAATLKDEEIATLLTWLRRSMGNDAPAVPASAVSAVRAATADRKSMWKAAELLQIPDR